MAVKSIKSVSLTLQAMEERAVPASMANGILYIVGTPDNDTVDVRTVSVNNTNMIQVTENGSVDYWKPSDVHLIKFWGLDGNDTFIYHGSKDVVASGGNGYDYIKTDGGNDHLYGGNGNDTLIAGAGNDKLWGGNGSDRLEGGDGNDVLYGEKGNDVLDGGNGNDQLHGGDGKDVMFGGNGNDQFWGGSHDTGMLSAPVTTPDGTATSYGIQDAHNVPGDQDKIWS
jgi:Ca2+-binding RTX toxin-like protein